MKVKFWGTTGSIAAPQATSEIEEKISSALKGYSKVAADALREELVKALPIDNEKDLAKLIKKITNGKAVESYLKKLPLCQRGTYRGNTSCTEVRVNEKLFIFDAGTGLRELGMSLMKTEFGKGKGTGYLFLSHTHFDHIDGWPFFIPAYIGGNTFHIYGPTPEQLAGEERKLEEVFAGQMNYDFFPVELRDLGSKGVNLVFHDIMGKETFDVDGVTVSTTRLHHPCPVLGYRVEHDGKVFVYETDSEPKYNLLEGHRDAMLDAIVEEFNLEVKNLTMNADVFVCDSQYTPQEFSPEDFGIIAPSKRGWGHSTYEYAVDIAKHGNVKHLCLYHHDPAHTDEFIEEIAHRAREYAGKVGYEGDISAAYEGMELEI